MSTAKTSEINLGTFKYDSSTCTCSCTLQWLKA